jgi:SpoVK/Ycf46/Vps4 family AAA+-type ATPase
MSRFIFPANPVLEAIKLIFSQLHNSKLEDEILDQCQDSSKVTMNFFNCNEQQAILLAGLLQLYFEDKEASMEELLSHIDMPLIVAGTLNQYLDVFVKRDWIRPEKDVHLFPETRYVFSKQMIQCVMLGDWSSMPAKEETAQNVPQLLNLFGKRLNAMKKGKTDFAFFSNQIAEMLTEHKKLSLPKFIRKQKLSKEDTCLFMHLCWQHFHGRSSVDIDRAVADFRFDAENKYYIRQSLTSQTSFLFKKELVELTEEDSLFAMTSYELTEKSLKAIDPNATKEIKQKAAGILSTRLPDSIHYKDLFYEEKQKELIEGLKEVMMPAKFQEICSRFRNKGLKAGITVLFYGGPGTGKTETALQLARHSGRILLLADASKIRSKWVGDTEKNIRELFVQYRTLRSKSKSCPILLFNEADAVLGKRRAVADRADQMENSLQNILLEELEEFEGIFIATTNLEKHLDDAFDRRFLYKLKFENPGQETRLSIWKDKFPDVEESMLLRVSRTYHLSGAQVENIQKKVTLDALLKPELRITETYLLKLADEECNFRGKETQEKIIIGFARGKKII